jgi:hypothetical protein
MHGHGNGHVIGVPGGRHEALVATTDGFESAENEVGVEGPLSGGLSLARRPRPRPRPRRHRAIGDRYNRNIPTPADKICTPHGSRTCETRETRGRAADSGEVSTSKGDFSQMNIKYLIGALVAVAFLSGGGVGCSQTREVGKSSKQLFRGEVGAVVQQSPAQVAQAVDAAIADLKLVRIGATTRPSKEQTETVVIARNAADAKVTVAFRATAADASDTRIAVTTGVMGRSDLRDQVWDAVRIRLGVLNLAANNAAANNPSPATQPTALAPASTQPVTWAE